MSELRAERGVGWFVTGAASASMLVGMCFGADGDAGTVAHKALRLAAYGTAAAAAVAALTGFAAGLTKRVPLRVLRRAVEVVAVAIGAFAAVAAIVCITTSIADGAFAMLGAAVAAATVVAAFSAINDAERAALLRGYRSE